MLASGKQKLGDFFRNRRERGFQGLPVVSVTLNDGLVGRDTLDRKTDTNLAPEEHLLIKAGDIAYNMMRMWQGASGLAQHDGIVSPAYVVLAPKNGIDPLFASYWFKSSRMIYLFWAYSYGLTNDRLRLYFKDFAGIPVSIPAHDEQVQIGKMLSLWDTAIAQTEKLIKAKQKLKTGLIQQLLTGKRRFPEYTESWKTVTIQDVCDVQIGGTPARKNAEYWAEPGTGHPWVSISDLNGKWITSTKEQIADLATKKSNTKLVTKGTALMSFKLTVGKTARAGIDLYTNEPLLLSILNRISLNLIISILHFQLQLVEH